MGRGRDAGIREEEEEEEKQKRSHGKVERRVK